jgi:hypothetical protein
LRERESEKEREREREKGQTHHCGLVSSGSTGLVALKRPAALSKIAPFIKPRIGVTELELRN